MAVHRKFRQGKKHKRHKRRQSESTTNFATFDLRHMICKMKIPFLILCLAVVYGACQTYGHEENSDLTAEIQSNKDYELDYANIPVERFLSRHRRASLLTPITFPMNTLLDMFGIGKGIISTIISRTIDSMRFVVGAMTGQENVCPKQQLSCLQALFQPTEMIKNIICSTFQAVSSEGKALTEKILDLSLQFFKNTFLPGLHATLNWVNKTFPLPPQIKALIVGFNVVYGFLQVIGYVPR